VRGTVIKAHGGEKRKTMPKMSEKGFTLIELLVAMAIAGALMTVMSASITVIMRTTQQNNDWNVNLRQVQNAGHWITEDTLQAQVVSDNTTGVFLHLQWNDWDNDNTVEYFLNGGNLTRSLNGGPAITIAQDVVDDPAFTSCDWDDDLQVLTVRIRAAQGNRFAEQTYRINPRPSNWGG
jgi:prepilin-type N-terminal cleavage/methylation domain-containing protein